MSCRAMGRTLEHFTYGHVAKALGYAPEIDFTRTDKNAPFSKFLDELSSGYALPSDRWKIMNSQCSTA